MSVHLLTSERSNERTYRAHQQRGILRDGLLVKKDRKTGEIKKLTKDNWDLVIGVNLKGATLMVHTSRKWQKPATRA